MAAENLHKPLLFWFDFWGMVGYNKYFYVNIFSI